MSGSERHPTVVYECPDCGYEIDTKIATVPGHGFLWDRPGGAPCLECPAHVAERPDGSRLYVPCGKDL